MMFESRTVHFTFETYLAACEALLVVMEHARKTDDRYRIIGRSPERMLAIGLTLEGEVEAISELVADTPGAILRSS